MIYNKYRETGARSETAPLLWSAMEIWTLIDCGVYFIDCGVYSRIVRATHAIRRDQTNVIHPAAKQTTRISASSNPTVPLMDKAEITMDAGGPPAGR